MAQIEHPLRQEIIAMLKKRGKDINITELKKEYGVPATTLYRIAADCNLFPPFRRRKYVGRICLDALRKDIYEKPSDSMTNRAKRFGISQPGLWQALKRLEELLDNDD